MKDAIKSWTCLNCDSEINSESHIVFCNEACLNEYISDAKDLEEFLIKQKEEEDDA